ncbi:MAG: alpha/beta hydrolase [bacterium]|nr:alpha/beta hydrolase [bacterium]
MEGRSHRIRTQGGHLHVGELGTAGRTLVMLHDGGGGYGSDPWPAPIPELVAGPMPWRVLRVDRLGYGLSDPRPTGFPPGFFDEDLAQLEEALDVLAPGEPLVLQGTSDGGTLALLAAARWGRRVAALAVDGAHYRTEPTMVPVLLDMQERFTAKHGPPAPDEPHQQRTLRAWLADWLAICAQGWSIEAELAAVRCPVAVLQGELDGIVPDRHAHELGAALGGPAHVEILPGGAHLCQRSHPEAWSRWLLALLEDPPQAPAARP